MKAWDKRAPLYRAAVLTDPKRPHITYGDLRIPDRWGVFQDAVGTFSTISAVRLDLIQGHLGLSLRFVGRDKLCYWPYESYDKTISYQWTVKCRRCGLDSRHVQSKHKQKPCCSKCNRSMMDELVGSPFLTFITKQKTLAQIYEENFNIDILNAFMLGSEVAELESTFRTYARLSPAK